MKRTTYIIIGLIILNFISIFLFILCIRLSAKPIETPSALTEPEIEIPQPNVNTITIIIDGQAFDYFHYGHPQPVSDVDYDNSKSIIVKVGPDVEHLIIFANEHD